MIGPDVAPVGTTNVIVVLLTIVKGIAVPPLRESEVAVLKLSPVTVTVVPTKPEVGVNEVIDGGYVGIVTVNVFVLLAVPSGLVTKIVPDVAPVGTTKVICVPLTIVNVRLIPFNVTEVALLKLVPLTVTVLPTRPDDGLKEVIVGGLGTYGISTVKLVLLVAVPSGLVTLIKPDVAPTGTTNVIVILSTTVNVTDCPFNVTAVALSKLVPLIVTVLPTESLVGENEVIVGGCGIGGTTINLPPLSFP